MAIDNLPLLRSEGSVLGRMSPLMRELRERGPVVKVRTQAGNEENPRRCKPSPTPQAADATYKTDRGVV
jgi:hypothetical protein